MTLGQWRDQFQAFKEIYNFETKQLLYKDVEDEYKQKQLEMQPVVSMLDL